jgi:hypothetical protein
MKSQGTNLHTIGSWVGRLLSLDFSALYDIRVEPAATTSAVGVVLVASLLAGLGSWLWALQSTELRGIDTAEVFVKSLLLGSLIQTAVWLLWVYLTYQVLVRAYGTRTDFPELTRIMGFAFAPVGLSLLIAVKGLAIPFGVIAFAMTILITNIAIQQTTNAGARESTIANLTGFTIFAIVMGVFANIAEVSTLGGLAPGIFFFSLDL